MRTVFCLLALLAAVGTADAGERVVLRARVRSFSGHVRSFNSVRANTFGTGFRSFHSVGFSGHGYGVGTVGLGVSSYGATAFRAFAGDPCYGPPVSEVVELKRVEAPVTTTTTTTTTETTETTGVQKTTVRKFIR